MTWRSGRGTCARSQERSLYPYLMLREWVEPGSAGGILSAQLSRSTGSRPPPAPPAAPRSGAPLADASNLLWSSSAAGSPRPAAPIPLFASPDSQQPEKKVRLGLAGKRRHGSIQQVRAALAAPFKPPVDASSFMGSQVGSQSSARRSARTAMSPSCLPHGAMWNPACPADPAALQGSQQLPDRSVRDHAGPPAHCLRALARWKRISLSKCRP